MSNIHNRDWTKDQKMCRTWNSCGCSFPSLALAARLDTSAQMAAKPLVWALNTMGVMRPLAVLTATLRSTTWFLEKFWTKSVQNLSRNVGNLTLFLDWEGKWQFLCFWRPLLEQESGNNLRDSYCIKWIKWKEKTFFRVQNCRCKKSWLSKCDKLIKDRLSRFTKLDN